MRIVYFGTPQFAVPALERLAQDDRVDVALVVTQPDRPKGRGRRGEPSPVKRAAEALALKVYQPESLRTSEDRRVLAEIGADLFVVAAYGRIFGSKLLALPQLGCVNLHASLLPKYRGASPVPAAILAGEQRTGITLMKMDRGLDTGPILAQAETDISADATTESLTAELATLAAELAARSLPTYVAGELPPTAQAAGAATVTRPLTKQDGLIDWSQPAVILERHTRAMWAWPKAWTVIDGVPLQVHEAGVTTGVAGVPPATILEHDEDLTVQCGDGALTLHRVQPAGRRAMTGQAFLAGRRGRVLTIDRVERSLDQPQLVTPVR